MRQCKQCSTSIIAKNAQAEFCSTRCRVANHRKRKNCQIPSQMLEKTRWVRWDETKRPITAAGTPASSINPSTWASHADVTASNVGRGIGFVLGHGIGCIDLDHCLIDGIPTPATQQILDKYPGNYIETSPSGDGLHIWGLLPEQPGTKRIENGVNIETYSVGRYITITNNVFQPGDLLPL